MCGVGEGEVVGERWVPMSVVEETSLDPVLDKLPVGEALDVEVPVDGAVAFCVISVGVTSRLSENNHFNRFMQKLILHCIFLPRL